MNKAVLLATVALLTMPVSNALAQASNVQDTAQQMKVEDVEASKTFLDIQHVTSNSGVEAWLVEDHSLPIISLNIGFKGAGSYNDAPAQQGLARLASNTMDEGAGEYDSKAFQKLLSDKSIAFGFSASRDNFQLSLKTLSKNKELAFELLEAAINDPRFDAEPVERMKQANISRIKSSMVNPDWLVARIMNDRLYGEDSYAQNSGGTLSTMASLTAEDLKQFVASQINKGRVNISVVGDITTDELASRIDQIFGSMQETASVKPLSKVDLTLGENYIYEMDIPQSSVLIVSTGIDRFDPDYQAAKVMNFILGGGGFGSRLTEEAREKRGLTYGIYSSLSNLDRAALFSVSTSTKNDSVQEMIDVVFAEIEKIKEQGVSEEELSNAKSYLIGSLPLSLTSTDKISGLMLSLQLAGRQQDYLEVREQEIQALTVQDIQAVANRILSGEFSTFIVGKPENLNDEYIKIDHIPNAE